MNMKISQIFTNTKEFSKRFLFQLFITSLTFITRENPAGQSCRWSHLVRLGRLVCSKKFCEKSKKRGKVQSRFSFIKCSHFAAVATIESSESIVFDIEFDSSSIRAPHIKNFHNSFLLSLQCQARVHHQQWSARPRESHKFRKFLDNRSETRRKGRPRRSRKKHFAKHFEYKKRTFVWKWTLYFIVAPELWMIVSHEETRALWNNTLGKKSAAETSKENS